MVIAPCPCALRLRFCRASRSAVALTSGRTVDLSASRASFSATALSLASRLLRSYAATVASFLLCFVLDKCAGARTAILRCTLTGIVSLLIVGGRRYKVRILVTLRRWRHHWEWFNCFLPTYGVFISRAPLYVIGFIARKYSFAIWASNPSLSL